MSYQADIRSGDIRLIQQKLGVGQRVPCTPSAAADIACKTSLLFPPEFLEISFLPGLTRFCQRAHTWGRRVLFHSDGSLTDILDELVAAGIDLLHPVEPLAGMRPATIDKQHPELILVGAVDVSQLLPCGTPQQ